MQFVAYRSGMAYDTSAQIFEISTYDRTACGIGSDTKFLLDPNGFLIQDPAQTTASFKIVNASESSSIGWSASTDTAWISSLSPSSGSLLGNQNQPLAFNINRSGMASNDIYSGRIVVNCDGFSKTYYLGVLTGTIDTGYYLARIVASPSKFYTTLASAYNAASTGDTIQCLPVTFNDTYYFNRPVNVTIESGMYYFCIPQDATTINGDAEISEGEISVSEGELRIGL